MVDAKSGDLLYGITMNFRGERTAYQLFFSCRFFVTVLAGNVLFPEVEGEMDWKIMTYEELKKNSKISVR